MTSVTKCPFCLFANGIRPIFTKQSNNEVHEWSAEVRLSAKWRGKDTLMHGKRHL